MNFTIECIAMLAIYTIVIVDFMRRHQKKYAIIATPFVILPLSYLLGQAIGNFVLENLFDFDPYWFMISAILVGITLSAMLIGGVSRTIKTKKIATYYIIFSFLYTCIIGIILAISLMKQFLDFNLISLG